MSDGHPPAATSIVRQAVLVSGLLCTAAATASAQRFQLETHLGAQMPMAAQAEWTERFPYSGNDVFEGRVEYRMGPAPTIGASATFWLTPMKGIQAVAAHSRGVRQVRLASTREVIEEHAAAHTLVGARLTTLLLGVRDFRLIGAAGALRVGFSGPTYREERPLGQGPVLTRRHAYGTTLAVAAELPVRGGVGARLSVEDVSYRMRYDAGPQSRGELESRRQHDVTLSAGVAVRLPRGGTGAASAAPGQTGDAGRPPEVDDE